MEADYGFVRHAVHGDIRHISNDPQALLQEPDTRRASHAVDAAYELLEAGAGIARDAVRNVRTVADRPGAALQRRLAARGGPQVVEPREPVLFEQCRDRAAPRAANGPRLAAHVDREIAAVRQRGAAMETFFER